MSLWVFDLFIPAHGFPRVSGDEPNRRGAYVRGR